MTGIIIFLGIISVIAVTAFYKMFKSIKRSIDRDYKYHININKKAFHRSCYPIIEVEIKGHKKNFLIDTGSPFNMINESCMDSIYEENDKVNIIRTHTIVGSTGKQDEQQVILEDIYINGEKFTEEFSVSNMDNGCKPIIDAVSGVKTSGLLGAEFFHKAKWSIDLDSLVVWVKK